MYLIPVILIVWTIDVFISFIRCPLHPEFSAPCSVNWILAVMYWIFLLISIILAVLSNKRLKEVKKKIEDEFMESVRNRKESIKNEVIDEIKKDEKWESKEVDKSKWSLKSKNKRIIVKWDSTLKEKSSIKKTSKKTSETKKSSTRKKITKK